MPKDNLANKHPLLNLDKLVHEPARLLILAQLFVVDSVDFLFLLRQTGMTQGNLSSHLNKLELGGYVDIQKEFVGKRPRTLLSLTKTGRSTFIKYVSEMKHIFNDLFNEINSYADNNKAAPKSFKNK
jgi:DNA-binding MarR family transcriptional regulator